MEGFTVNPIRLGNPATGLPKHQSVNFWVLQGKSPVCPPDRHDLVEEIRGSPTCFLQLPRKVFLSMADQMGAKGIERHGDSTGRLEAIGWPRNRSL